MLSGIRTDKCSDRFTIYIAILILLSVNGDRQIVLQFKGQETVLDNLSELEIQQFEQAWQHRT